MKKTLIFFTLIIPVICFSQASRKEIKTLRKETARKELYAEIRMSELIVNPSDYLLYKCPVDSISHIVFERQTNFNNTKEVYACITEKDGFNNNYSIGTILNYCASETLVRYFITVYMKDGSHQVACRSFDFSNGWFPDNNQDYEVADYDAYGAPFGGEWDGIIIEAH